MNTQPPAKSSLIRSLLLGFDLSKLNPDDLRIFMALVSLVIVGFVLAFLSLSLRPNSVIATLLLDRESQYLPYPFTIQNVMHVMFALGVGEVFVRLYGTKDARRQLTSDLLDIANKDVPHTLDSLKALEEKVARDGLGNERHIHRLIKRIVVQFRATGNVGDAQAVLDSSVEYFQHEIGLRYSMLRYLIWVLPTLGFIGTLIGISLALGTAGNLPDLGDPESLEMWIANLTKNLGVAFYTTLVALILSAILMFLNNLASSREERVLNETSQHCLDFLINRLRNLGPNFDRDVEVEQTKT